MLVLHMDDASLTPLAQATVPVLLGIMTVEVDL